MKPFIAEMSCDFHLEVAHWMPNFPERHPNRRVHGHSYMGRVYLKGPVDVTTGVVMEYSELKASIDQVICELDHHLMNDVPGLEIPTSEHLARWIWEALKPKLKHLVEVKLERPTIGMSVSFRGDYL